MPTLGWSSARNVLALAAVVVVGVSAAYLAASFLAFPGVEPPVDFLVYRLASERVLTGVDLYATNVVGAMMPPGGMPFTYTPFAALALLPTALSSWQVAYAVWTVLSVGVVVGLVQWLTPRDLPRRRTTVVVLAVLLAASSVVMHHLIFGQINLFLLALVLFDVRRRTDGAIARLLPPGVLVGVAAAIKLTPALFVVFFVLTRQWRRAAWACAGALGATLAGALVLPETSRRFWTDTLWHLGDRVGFMANGIATSGNNTVTGIVTAVAGRAGIVAAVLSMLVAAAGLACATWLQRRGRDLDAILAVGLTAVSVAPISWIHHWVFLLPAALVLLFRRSLRSRRTAVIGGFFLLTAVGPYLGDVLLPGPPLLPTIHASGPLPVVVLGALLRESFLVSAVAAVAALIVDARRGRGIPVPSVTPGPGVS